MSRNKREDEFGNWEYSDCPECKGLGHIRVSECCDEPLGSDNYCPKCKDICSGQKCKKCNGTGSV